MNLRFFSYNLVLKIKHILLLIIFILLINVVKCYQLLKTFNTLSNDVIILCEDGIIKYDTKTETQTLIEPYNILKGIGNIKFVSISQFPLEEGGYILCRIQNYIYLLSRDANESYGFVYVDGIYNVYTEMIHYTTKNNKKSFIIAFINQLKINLLMYEINFTSYNDTELSFKIEHQILYGDSTIFDHIISCEVMMISNEDKLLSCFLFNNKMNIISSIFDPENNFKLLNLTSEIEENEVRIITRIPSVDPKKNLVCYINSSNNLKCFIYTLANEEWTEPFVLFEYCTNPYNSRGIIYNNKKNEYLIYCYTSDFLLSMIKLDENFDVKYTSSESEICRFTFELEYYYSMSTSSLFYSEYKDTYYIASYGFGPNDYEKFRISEIEDKCINATSKNNSITHKTTNLILTSFPKTSIIKSTLINIKTIKTSIPSNDLLSTISKEKSIIQEITSIPKFTTIPKLTTIPKFTSIPKLTTIPKFTSIPKFTTILSSTYMQIKSSTISTKNSISSSPFSSFISLNSTISSISSTTTNQIISSAPNIRLSSTSLKYTSLSFSSKIYNDDENKIFNIKDINFNYVGDILTGKINNTIEEIEKNLNNIVEQIEIGKKYEINGEDYNLLISPVEDIDTFQSTHVEFSICEQILRKEYNMSQEEIITIIQIDFDKLDERSLTNQVEYEVYDENKTKLNLSYCKDVQIQVIYKIEDQELINKTMISYFSNNEVDVFNIKDSFFNDICYPYSNSNSDIILKDRVLDIYQNFSLCDKDCEYEKINIETMSVECTCQIKTELNTEVEPPVFGKIIEETLKNSNFGVIQCYKLVFDFKRKKNNIGFWLYLVFVIINIICFIYYFIFGNKSIKIFVFKEMYKNGYLINLSKNLSSPIKKANNNKTKIRDNKKFKTTEIKDNKDLENNSSSKNKIFKENESQIEKIIKKNKIQKTKKNIKIKNPIMIFQYNYYKLSKNKNNSVKSLIKTSKKKNKNKKKINLESIEEEKKCPGYYILIQIDANNENNREPPESKYILNNYNFNNAIKYDNRDFWRIFYIVLLSKENILNTFFFKASLETQSLRLSLFIFSYSCEFALNALFYFNQKISDKYHYEGENLFFFTLVNNLVIVICSTLFLYILVKFFNLLISSKDSFENVFRPQEEKMRKNKSYKVNNENKKVIYRNIIDIFRILKIKIMCYIIIEFILLLFFFYYITAFCEVYQSTQVSLISDSFLSFLFSIPLELIDSFLLSALYVTSIRYKFQKLYNIIIFFYELG